MGNADMPEAMGIANWESSTLTCFLGITFFVVRVAYSYAADIYMLECPLKHHLCGDSYRIRVAPVNKANIITHPREKGSNEILHLDHSHQTKH